MIEKNLKTLLDINKISVAQLSRETGIPRTNIHQWLTGSSPNIEQAYKVAKFFNMTLEELCIEKCSDSVRCVAEKIYIESGTYKIELVKVDDPEEMN